MSANSSTPPCKLWDLEVLICKTYFPHTLYIKEQES